MTVCGGGVRFTAASSAYFLNGRSGKTGSGSSQLTIEQISEQSISEIYKR